MYLAADLERAFCQRAALRALRRTFVVAVVLLAAASAGAEQEALTLETMVDVADEVVVGEVETSEAQWEGRLIVTVSTVRVDEALKGNPAGRVEVVQYGGTVLHPRLQQPVTMTASGISLLREGEEVVLLVTGSGRERRQLVGGDQGKFVVQRELGPAPSRVPDAPKRLRVERRGGVRHLEGEVETLDRLRARIRDHVERSERKGGKPAGKRR